MSWTATDIPDLTGKTALITALTGTNTDRLKEEKERGITIDLGFADLAYPDGLTVVHQLDGGVSDADRLQGVTDLRHVDLISRAELWLDENAPVVVTDDPPPSAEPLLADLAELRPALITAVGLTGLAVFGLGLLVGAAVHFQSRQSFQGTESQLV